MRDVLTLTLVCVSSKLNTARGGMEGEGEGEVGKEGKEGEKGGRKGEWRSK